MLENLLGVRAVGLVHVAIALRDESTTRGVEDDLAPGRTDPELARDAGVDVLGVEPRRGPAARAPAVPRAASSGGPGSVRRGLARALGAPGERERAGSFAATLAERERRRVVLARAVRRAGSFSRLAARRAPEVPEREARTAPLALLRLAVAPGAGRAAHELSELRELLPHARTLGGRARRSSHLLELPGGLLECFRRRALLATFERVGALSEVATQRVDLALGLARLLDLATQTFDLALALQHALLALLCIGAVALWWLPRLLRFTLQALEATLALVVARGGACRPGARKALAHAFTFGVGSFGEPAGERARLRGRAFGIGFGERLGEWSRRGVALQRCAEPAQRFVERFVVCAVVGELLRERCELAQRLDPIELPVGELLEHALELARERGDLRIEHGAAGDWGDFLAQCREVFAMHERGLDGGRERSRFESPHLEHREQRERQRKQHERPRHARRAQRKRARGLDVACSAFGALDTGSCEGGARLGGRRTKRPRAREETAQPVRAIDEPRGEQRRHWLQEAEEQAERGERGAGDTEQPAALGVDSELHEREPERGRAEPGRREQCASLEHPLCAHAPGHAGERSVQGVARRHRGELYRNPGRAFADRPETGILDGSRLVGRSSMRMTRGLGLACGVAFFAFGCGDDAQSDDPSSVTKVVGPAGGELVLPDGAGVTIPEGALDEEIEITVARLSDSEAGALAELLPNGLTLVSDLYAFTPHGQEFLLPVEIRVPYDSSSDALAMQSLDDETDTSWGEDKGAAFADDVATLETEHFSIKGVTAGRADTDAGMDGGDGRTDSGAETTDSGTMTMQDAGGDAAGDAASEDDAGVEQDAGADAGGPVDVLLRFTAADGLTTLTGEVPGTPFGVEDNRPSDIFQGTVVFALSGGTEIVHTPCTGGSIVANGCGVGAVPGLPPRSYDVFMRGSFASDDTNVITTTSLPFTVSGSSAWVLSALLPDVRNVGETVDVSFADDIGVGLYTAVLMPTGGGDSSEVPCLPLLPLCRFTVPALSAGTYFVAVRAGGGLDPVTSTFQVLTIN